MMTQHSIDKFNFNFFLSETIGLTEIATRKNADDERHGLQFHALNHKNVVT